MKENGDGCNVSAGQRGDQQNEASNVETVYQSSRDLLTKRQKSPSGQRYVNHEVSKPMNIIWRLEKPILAKFIGKTGKMMVQ